MKKLLLGLSLLFVSFAARPANAAAEDLARRQPMTRSCAAAVIGAARHRAIYVAHDEPYKSFILNNFYQDPSTGVWMVGFTHYPYESTAHVVVGPGCRILGIEVYDNTNQAPGGR